MNDKVTIKDIAKLANVSVATVSRVINNNGRFSEKTRDKILKIIDETGYETNYIAKSLRINKSFTIGIIVPDISNYFFYTIVQRIEQIMFKRGYTTIICNTDKDIEKEKSYLKMLQNKRVDGIIIISGALDFEFEKAQIPYVCIDREPKHKSNTIFISSDHYTGGYLATEQLLKTNSKYPLIIYYNNKSQYSKLRIRGFSDCLADHKIKPEKFNFLKSDYDTIKEDLTNKLKNHPNIDSIFAINDRIATQALKILNNLNIKIPNQIQLIGFDGSANNKYLFPELSSVKQNVTKLAEESVHALIKLMNDNHLDLGNSITIPVELVLGGSTR